jgi:thioredoxin-related protein
MKNITLIFFILICASSNGQISILPITEIENDTTNQKILMISADWCSICKHNLKEFKKENNESISLYLIEENEPNGIVYNNQLFSGIENGVHSFIDYLMPNNLIYPSYFLIDNNGNIINMHQGFIEIQQLINLVNK